ncbi:MAG: hypothetical protein MUE53_00805 [Chitinophagales bacterium]|jgi:hypothetical protein|nr:hypothetical protein [Chitinophagales bacterium]
MNSIIYVILYAVIFLSACRSALVNSSIKAFHEPVKNIDNIGICKGVGGDLILNKTVARSLENEMKVHFDTIIDCDQITEKLHEHGIMNFDEYTLSLLKKISNYTKQRFLIVPTILLAKESVKGTPRNSESAQLRVNYQLYDSLKNDYLFSTLVNADGGDGANLFNTLLVEKPYLEPSKLIESLPQLSKHATKRIFDFIGISFDMEAKYIRDPNYQKQKDSL